jgi:hypothetical protein
MLWSTPKRIHSFIDYGYSTLPLCTVATNGTKFFQKKSAAFGATLI